MNHLSLFTGAGGGELGALLLGWDTIGYVEWDSYCQKVLAQRIKDGILNEAPIFSDIRAFNSEGYARSYQGLVDVISGGFPCQPFSVAGKQAGADDERNMWPPTIDCIRLVRPRYCLLENVPGLIATGYFSTVLGELAEAGYDARWKVISAAEVGAPHKRDRLWIMAVSNTERHEKGVQPRHTSEAGGQGLLAYSKSPDNTQQDGEVDSRGKDVKGWEPEVRVELGGCSENVAYSNPEGLEGWQEAIRQEEGRECYRGYAGETPGFDGRNIWWDVEPNVGRVANGVASRVDRLKALGNGQVPAVVRAAWEILSDA